MCWFGQQTSGQPIFFKYWKLGKANFFYCVADLANYQHSSEESCLYSTFKCSKEMLKNFFRALMFNIHLLFLKTRKLSFLQGTSI